MSPLNRRELIGGATAAAALSIGSLRFVIPRAQADDDAKALLDKAAKAMTELTSFNFVIRNEGGKTVLLNLVELESIEGTVLRPDKFTAKATAKVAVLSVDVTVIGVGTDIYVSDPTAPEGTYIVVSANDVTGFDITTVINPDALILKAVAVIDEPKLDGTAKIDGADTTKVSGTFIPIKVIDLTGIHMATPEAGSPEAQTAIVLDQPLDVTFWIDDDGRVRQVRIIGQILTSDDPGIARIIKLSKFNEPVTIEAPPNATPLPSAPGGP